VIIEVEDERNGVVGLLWLLQEACFFFLKRESSLVGGRNHLWWL
jgi:hypothetical protein